MGYRIRELREAMKMTQEELADKSGVSRGTISALENGSMRNHNQQNLAEARPGTQHKRRPYFFY